MNTPDGKRPVDWSPGDPDLSPKKPRPQSQFESADMSESDEDLFAAEDAPTGPSQKEQRHNNLSKFVQRMLDPNRERRHLIEPPQIIPLNDEFLQAFGRREKEYDAQIGRTTEIDHTIDDDPEDPDLTLERQAEVALDKDDKNSRKVKISNLKYTTTKEVLQEECLNFGTIEEITLLMDDTDSTKNVGRAYVVFDSAQAAQSCVDQQLGGTLDGRPIRVALASETPHRSGGSGKDEKRYWQKDISTKCFRCGQVGHMEAECNNQSKADICPLCAKPNEHEMRQCPLNRICFNCGVPGHINRDCNVRRGTQAPRLICTLCCGSGHTRFDCQRSATNIPGIHDAICLVCAKKGHFMCKELKWFFGLDGVFCYNCGGRGHVGNQCQRPTLDDLSRDQVWTLREVERGEEYKLADEAEQQQFEREKKEREREQQRHQDRERQRNRYREQDRARSAPHQRSSRDYYDDFTSGHNDYSNGGGEYRYNIDDSNANSNNNRRNNNNNRGYSNTKNSNSPQSGGRRRGYR